MGVPDTGGILQYWQISANISKMVQDVDIVTKEHK